MSNISSPHQAAFAMIPSAGQVQNGRRGSVGCLVFLAVLLGGEFVGRSAQVSAADPSDSADTRVELAAAAGGVQRIVAHRGSRLDRPENTIAAIERAIEAGATAVEIDIRSSRDGKLVVMHDHKVDRTTNGTGRVNDLTWAQLATLDAGSWFGSDYGSERVPSLEQALQVCCGRIGVQLDLKEVDAAYTNRVAASVKTFGEPTRTTAAVRTVEQARQLKKRLPEISTLILLIEKKKVDALLAANVGYFRTQVAWIENDPTLLTKIREGGAKIHLDATAGTPEKVVPLLKYRPESLLCDDPEQLIKTLSLLQSKDRE